MMSLLVWLVASALGSGMGPVPLSEIACSAIVQPAGGLVEIVNDDNLRVLDRTGGEAEFRYGRADTRAIRCMRSNIIPAIDDYKVLRAGFPLYIVQSVDGDDRVGVLEVSGGQYRFRMTQGELSSDERQALQARIGEIQEASRTGA